MSKQSIKGIFLPNNSEELPSHTIPMMVTKIYMLKIDEKNENPSMAFLCERPENDSGKYISVLGELSFEELQQSMNDLGYKIVKAKK